MKYSIMAIAIPVALLIVACSPTAKETTEIQQSLSDDGLYSYIQDNLDYTITDLRVVQEDNGYNIVINVPGTPDMLQDLCIDTISCINNYENIENTPVAKINPIILSDNGA